MLGIGMPMQTLLQKVDMEIPALFALVCIFSYSSGPRYTAIRFFFDGIFASGVERFTANEPLTPGGQDAR
jgi:hypothetical protein